MNHWPAFTVTFRCEALFEQTPGPGAGGPLTRETAALSHGRVGA